jgi:hypothetical protein
MTTEQLTETLMQVSNLYDQV